MFSMAKIMVEERGETLRESPLFSTTNKEKVYKILQRKKREYSEL